MSNIAEVMALGSSKGAPIQAAVTSMGVLVRYPWARSTDWYLAMRASTTMHCTRCGQDFERTGDALVAHIRSHDRRKRPATVYIAGPVKGEG